MSSVEIDYLGEGRSDEVVARRLISAAEGIPGVSYLRPIRGVGKQSLDTRLRGLNAGVQFGKPVLVLRDLDNESCAVELLNRLIPNRHPRLLLRICVREAEAWLMADRTAYARHCGVKEAQIPAQPEQHPDPKKLLIHLANAGSAIRLARFLADTRRRGVPDFAALGEFNAEFAEDVWDPVRAAKTGNAPSLQRALSRLQTVTQT